MRVLVFGVSGMLGNAVFKMFCEGGRYDVWGTMRSPKARRFFPDDAQDRLLSGIEVLNTDTLVQTLERVDPDVVINCVGLIKQLADADDPLVVLPINTLLPHRLARLCGLAGIRLIHVSTDCVFSGRKGGYVESDLSDAEDLYGKSKYIGELPNQPHAITLRTSIIGHELDSNYSLVDWFLSQEVKVKGFSKAIFSGFPTVELARIMRDVVVPLPDLHGLYHISAQPIAKLDLLQLIASVYGKDIIIEPDDKVVIDRSLNSGRFGVATGYIAPEWSDLISNMCKYHRLLG